MKKVTVEIGGERFSMRPVRFDTRSSAGGKEVELRLELMSFERTPVAKKFLEAMVESEVPGDHHVTW